MTTDQIQTAKLIVRFSELEEALAKLNAEVQSLGKAIEDKAQKAFGGENERTRNNSTNLQGPKHSL